MTKKEYVAPKRVVIKLEGDYMLQKTSVFMNDTQSSEESWNDGGDLDGGVIEF